MTSPARREASKFARYRQRKHAQGKKLLRLWVINPNAPGFAEEVARQIAVLREAPEQKETLAFFEAIEREDGWPE